MDRKWWTLIVVCVATFMLLLDVSIVNVALPKIQTELGSNFADLQWVADAYALTLAALLLTAGSLADLFGRRLVFLIGLVIFSVSSLLSGLAPDPLFLNIARGGQGIGAAAMFATALALLGNSFRGRERGTAFGVWGAITGLAVAVGPLVGGLIISGISWRWIFLVNVPIGAVAVVMTLLHVDESRVANARRPDLIGFVTFTGALGALVYALIKANTKGWGSTLIVACFAASALLLVAFLIAERRESEPMFDLSLFRKPTFAGGSIAAFGLSCALFGLFLYITLYLQDVLHFTPLQTGVRFLVLSGGMIVTSAISGRLTARVPIRALIGPGLALVAAGLFLMRGLNVSSGWTDLVPGLVVAGMGTGMINPPLASTAIGVVEPEDAGMASGINTTFRQVGIATGIAALGSVFSHVVRTTIVTDVAGARVLPIAAVHRLAAVVSTGSGATQANGKVAPAARGVVVHALRHGFTSGLNLIFLIGGVIAAVSAVLTFWLIRQKDFTSSAALGGAPAAAGEPATEPREPIAAARAVASESGGDGAGGGDLRARAEAVLTANERASIELDRQLASMVERHRDALLREAEADAERARARALEDVSRYEGELRSLQRELERDRTLLAARVRSQLEEGDRAVQSPELEQLVQTLAALASNGAPAAAQVER